MDDGRRYEHVVALRAVDTIDFIAAKWAELLDEPLGRVSTRIVNEVDDMPRVVYEVNGKPPGRTSGNRAMVVN